MNDVISLNKFHAANELNSLLEKFERPSSFAALTGY